MWSRLRRVWRPPVGPRRAPHGLDMPTWTFALAVVRWMCETRPVVQGAEVTRVLPIEVRRINRGAVAGMAIQAADTAGWLEMARDGSKRHTSKLWKP